jgi:hypothetical protein
MAILCVAVVEELDEYSSTAEDSDNDNKKQKNGKLVMKPNSNCNPEYDGVDPAMQEETEKLYYLSLTGNYTLLTRYTRNACLLLCFIAGITEATGHALLRDDGNMWQSFQNYIHEWHQDQYWRPFHLLNWEQFLYVMHLHCAARDLTDKVHPLAFC